jgi:hypothetical protein
MVLLAIAMAGCTAREPVVLEPDTVGVVQTRTLIGKDLHFELADGRVFVSPANMDYLGGSQPQVGDLLLAGTSPDLWVLRVTPETQSPNPERPLCYRLYGQTRASGDQVFKSFDDPARADLAIVFSKALNWRDVGANQEKLFGALTCINAAGEAFEQRFASAEG